MKSTFKIIPLAILLFMVSLPAGRTAEAADGWSEVVDGLRARLVFGEERILNGTRLPEVYLELHNASDIGNPMEFGFDAGRSISFELRDSDEDPGPKGSVSVDGFVFGAFHITIPQGGTLKFPITWKGYGIPRDGGILLGFQSLEAHQAVWVIPADDQSEYFLSATLKIPETPRDSTSARPWHGTIALPAVKVPTATAND